MTEFNCPVVQINKLEPVPNSDSLEMTTMFETNCIVRKGQLKPGDLAVYIPIESVIDMTKPQFQGLGIKVSEGKEKYRVKAVRLRGTYSEGLLVPYVGDSWTPNSDALDNWSPVGRDLAPEWGITKYEEPERPESGQVGQVNSKSPEAPDMPWVPRYSVQQLVRNRDAIPEGTLVEVTEKIHGCVSPGAKIVMADGSFRKMKDVRVGDFVLGEKNGVAQASEVLEKFHNGTTSKWIQFTTTNFNAGRGLSKRTFKCTPNHEVFVNGKYIPASHVQVGDEVLVNRLDMQLNPIQEQVLIGKILGDASIAGKAIKFGHSEKQAEYMQWMTTCIGPLMHPTLSEQISGYGSKMLTSRTVNSDLVQNLGARFLRNGQKVVPSDLVLTPVSLAFWYMDDGSLSTNQGQLDRASFAVCGFDTESVANLKVALSRLGIDSNITGEPGRLRLSVPVNAAELMFLMISPYIHASLQYKLPERYRGGSFWIPKIEHKPLLVPQTVTHIVHRSESMAVDRLDMHTETNNYFVGGVLVHNCNGRYAFSNGQFHVGSHNAWRKPMYDPLFGKKPVSDGWQLTLKRLLAKLTGKKLTPNNTDDWWTIAKTLDLETKLAKFPNLVVYGEVFGKVQDLKYGCPDGVKFKIFDIYNIDTKNWFSPEEVTTAAARMGLEKVDVLYSGPYTKAAVDHLRTGKSVIDGKTIREGIVIKPHDNKGKHIALKLVSEEYKLRKGGTEFH